MEPSVNSVGGGVGPLLTPEHGGRDVVVDLRHVTGVAELDLRAQTRSDVPDAATVAVLVPCRDEEATIATVVTDFRAVLPDATVYVYDNGSSDATASVAARAGAVVRHVGEPGKGNVLRRMFADIEADIYVVVDGDDTYEAAAASLGL